MSAVQRAKNLASAALRHAWRMVILVVGGTVVAIGVAMIVLPGPAVVVIPIGLGILATEFAWARHLLHAARDRARTLVNNRTNGRFRSAGTDPAHAPAEAVAARPTGGGMAAPRDSAPHPPPPVGDPPPV